LEAATFKTKRLRKENDELKEENRRLERNSITLDGKPTSQAAINALVARVEGSRKQLQDIQVWAVENDDEQIVYSAFHQWLCTKWIEDNEELHPGVEFGIVNLNVQGVPDLYGEDPSSKPAESLPAESLKATAEKIVIDAQKEAAKVLKSGASPQDVARAQLRVMSAVLAALSYTLTQVSPTV
jgi:hypothetical protein